jgi:hypothetical protein
MKQQYSGTCYIGVAGSEIEVGECHDSITNIVARNGDEGPYFWRGTKGYEVRQKHLDNWYENTHHPFMLLLDADMIFAQDVLERLRAHGLPYVSGYYLRRRYAPIAPVWFKVPPRHVFPLEPWLTVPETGKLHPLGASGWGCTLIHRDVVAATKPLLKGEPEIIEDDMDVWPYSLPAVTEALRAIRTLVDERPSPTTAWPALAHHLETLEREIRPLRAVKDETIGSDIRYPFFAREAGFQLMGDPETVCGHMLNFPLNPDQFALVYTAEQRADLAKNVSADWHAERRAIKKALEAL